jgi:hypothetical protein
VILALGRLSLTPLIKAGDISQLYVDEARFNQDLSNIDTFGLDETSVAKGYDYMSGFTTLFPISKNQNRCQCR